MYLKVEAAPRCLLPAHLCAEPEETEHEVPPLELVCPLAENTVRPGVRSSHLMRKPKSKTMVSQRAWATLDIENTSVTSTP